MKIERTRNAARNILFGAILKIYQIIVPFVLRSVILNILGEQYLGLNSLFTSVLQVLNLAELGVGSAMVYSMYKPIADDDTDSICALLNLYKIYYRVIGAVILVAGVIILPFIPKLISGEIPQDMNVYVLYLMNLFATVLSYWFLAYKESILQAHQRTDVQSKITMATETVKYALQITVLVLFKNYYWFVLAIVLIQLASNIVTALAAERMYPDYRARGVLEKSKVKLINSRIRDLFTSKVGMVVINSVDTIVISAFLGLAILGRYQNYYYIITSISAFIAIVFSACKAGVGNSIISESKEKNFSDFRQLMFIIAWISGICVICYLCLVQPFMTWWMGEKMVLPLSIVACFCIYFYISQLNAVMTMYKDAAGIWHKDKFRPLVVSLANLTLNLLTVKFAGLYGIILSTVVSMFLIGMPWLMHNLFNLVFEKDMVHTFVKKFMWYIFVSAAVAAVTGVLCSFINLPFIYTFLLRSIICVVLPNVIFYMIYRKTEEFKLSVGLVDRVTRGKISFLLERIK